MKDQFLLQLSLENDIFSSSLLICQSSTFLLFSDTHTPSVDLNAYTSQITRIIKAFSLAYISSSAQCILKRQG